MSSPRTSARRLRRPSALHLVLLPLSLIFVFPFVQMVTASFMSNKEISQFPPALLPHALNTKGYSTVIFDSDFFTWLGNTALISTVAVLSQIVLCTLAGYGFARIRFRGALVVQFLLLLTVFLPPQLLMIPIFKLYAKAGLVDTLPSLMIPWLASAIGVFLMRQFFTRLPREIEEAAMIDGCSRLGLLFRILLPLMRPALVTVALLTLLNSWNDFLWPLISISDPSHNTLQLGLITYQGQHRTEWATLMAGNVLVTAPLLALFLLGQRQFVKSLSFGAVKG